jgi:putative aminopeptidase FrvX
MSFVMEVQTTRLPLQNASTFILKGIVKVFWMASYPYEKAKRRTPKISNLFIDIGCETTRGSDKMGVHVGCVITYPDEFMILNE